MMRRDNNVCLTCRVAARGISTCGRCGQPMVTVSYKREVPRKSDIAGWNTLTQILNQVKSPPRDWTRELASWGSIVDHGYARLSRGCGYAKPSTEMVTAAYIKAHGNLHIIPEIVQTIGTEVLFYLDVTSSMLSLSVSGSRVPCDGQSYRHFPSGWIFNSKILASHEKNLAVARASFVYHAHRKAIRAAETELSAIQADLAVRLVSE